MPNKSKQGFYTVIHSFIKKISPEETYHPEDGLAYWREQIFMRFIAIIIFGSTLVVGLIAILTVQQQYWSVLIVDLLAYTAAIIAAFAKRLSLQIRIHIFMIVIFSLGVALQIIGGPIGNGSLLLFLFPMMAAALLSLRAAAIALSVNLVTLILLGFLLNLSLLEHTGMGQYTMIDWVGTSVGFIFFNTLITFSLSVLLEGLMDGFTRSKKSEAALKESRERYQAIIEDQTELIDRWEPDGTMTFVNQACADYLGRPRESLIGENFFSFIPEEQTAALKEDLKKLTPENPVITIEEITVIDGKNRWMRWTIRALFDENGKLKEYQSVGSDITDHKRTEEELERSESRYRAIVETQSEIISRWRPDTSLTFINDAGCQFYNKTKEELLQTSIIDLAPEDDKQLLREYVASFSTDNPSQTIELSGPDRFGNIHWFEWQDHALIENGQIVEFQSIGRDITKEKHIRVKLLKSESRYRAVVEDQLELICRMLPDGTINFANHAYAHFFGMIPDDLIGSNLTAVVDPQEAAKLVKKFSQLNLENPSYLNTHLETNDHGENRWFAWTNHGIFDEQGNLTEIQAIGQDVHERILAQAALEKSEARYRAIIEDQTELLCRVSPNGIYTFVNNAYARFHGKSPGELIGCEVKDVVQPDIMSQITKGHLNLTPDHPIIQRFSLQTNTKKETRWFSWIDRGIFNAQGELIEVQAIGRDIHDQKLAEQALLESEARYRAIVEGQIEPICRWKPDFTLTFVNDAYCNLFGKEREALLKHSFQSTVPDEDWQIIEKMIKKLSDGAPHAIGINRVITARGPRWLQWALSGIRSKNGLITEFQSVGHDISKQKQTQRMLQKSLSKQIKLTDANRELVQRLEGLYLTDVNRHEAQLSHLANELHDDVLNALAVVSANLDPEETPKHVINAYEQAIHRTREIVNGLRTTMLNYGLYIGLETLADELSDQFPNGPIFYMDIPRCDIRYDLNVELHLFRIVQEACNNAIKHANASEIHIKGVLKSDKVILEVEDNGRGFAAEDILDLHALLREQHFGLAGMFERAELIRGELSINSIQQQCSCIRVCWEADKKH